MPYSGIIPQFNKFAVNAADLGLSPLNTSAQNSSAIAAAIVSLPSTGGVILIPFGNYNINQSIIIDNDNITLWGFGDRGGAATFTVDPSVDPTFALIVGNTKNVNNVLIHGIFFQGKFSTTSTGAGINWRCVGGGIKQAKVAGFGGTGINVVAFSATIFEVFLEDVTLIQNGMNTTTPGDNLVIAGSVTDSEYHRIISLGNSAKNTTRHCINNSGSTQKFVNCHCYFANTNGFNQVSGTNNQILGGEYETNGNVGILQNGTSNLIKGARLFGNTNADIEMDSGDHCSYEGNICSSSGANSILGFGLTTSVIANNTLQNAATSINVSNTTSKLHIHDNICDGATNGISCGGTNCDIHDNLINQGNLIEVTGATNNNIHDNTIANAAKTITLIGTTTTQIRNNPGYNPQAGAVATPAVPLTATPIQNVTGNDVMVYILAGTVTAISVGNTSGGVVATGLLSSASGVSVLLKATQWISWTGSVAPTWKWLGV